MFKVKTNASNNLRIYGAPHARRGFFLGVDFCENAGKDHVGLRFHSAEAASSLFLSGSGPRKRLIIQVQCKTWTVSRDFDVNDSIVGNFRCQIVCRLKNLGMRLPRNLTRIKVARKKSNWTDFRPVSQKNRTRAIFALRKQYRNASSGQ